MSSIDQFIFRRSCTKIALQLMSSIVLAAAGIFILIHGTLKWVGWMGIIFFGGCAISYIWQLLDSRPRVIIGESGIFDRTLRVGVIPWKEITDAFPRTLFSGSFVCLTLRKPEMFVSRLPRRNRVLVNLNRRFGFTHLSINLTGIDVNAADVCDLILERINSEHGNAD